MKLHVYLACSLSIFPFALSLEGRSSFRIAVTPHVFPLIAAPNPNALPPSTAHLHKRRNFKRSLSQNGSSSPAKTAAPVEQALQTLGGRVYMTTITLASRPYTMILDTGSSDTWVAASTFTCKSRSSGYELPQRSCGFGELFDAEDSASYERMEGAKFGVRYADGEFLEGEMGKEDVVFGVQEGEGKGELEVRQVIGVVDQGWWMGDGRSSGLVGLAYSTLTSGHAELNYTSVVFSLIEAHGISPIFSLALSRPTPQSPTAGGLLAIGGIPDIRHDSNFATVPIHPFASDNYAYYTIPVDGFALTPLHSTDPSATPDNLTVLNTATGDKLNVIIDSGSTHIYLPDRLADRIAASFDPPARFAPQSNTYSAPCDATPPEFGVILAGKTFWVDGRDMLDGDVGGRGRCVVSVQRMGKGKAVFGDMWLRGVVVVFDVGVGEVRVAGRGEY